MDKDKKYTILQNLSYCLKETEKGCPKLLVFCVCVILANSAVPVITAFLPKVIIEEITIGSGLKRLLLITGGLALALALTQTVQKYLERMIYWNKFKMNTYFLRKDLLPITGIRRMSISENSRARVSRAVTVISRTFCRHMMRLSCSFQTCSGLRHLPVYCLHLMSGSSCFLLLLLWWASCLTAKY